MGLETFYHFIYHGARAVGVPLSVRPKECFFIAKNPFYRSMPDSMSNYMIR